MGLLLTKSVSRLFNLEEAFNNVRMAVEIFHGIKFATSLGTFSGALTDMVSANSSGISI
jgi:hypothetical protein